MGRPPVETGISGALLIQDGVSRLDTIQFNPPLVRSSQDIGPAENTVLATNVIGYWPDGRLFILQLRGDPDDPIQRELTVKQTIEVLLRLGVRNAILSGTSGDVQRYSPFQQPQVASARGRANSELQHKLEDLLRIGRRRMGTCLVFYECPTLNASSPPGALGIWASLGIRNLIVIGILEGAIFGALAAAHLRSAVADAARVTPLRDLRRIARAA